MFNNKKIVKFIKVDGMKCEGCVKRIENMLMNFNEIDSCEVKLTEKTVKVILKRDIPNEKLKNMIEDLEFKVIDIQS